MKIIGMKNLFFCFSAIVCFKLFAVYTYVTNEVDDVVWIYRIDGDEAAVLRVARSESADPDMQKNIVIPNVVAGANVRAVADDAFNASSWLRAVTIQGSVTQIGVEAFANCSNLVSVIIEREGKLYGLHRINSFAFLNCVSLLDIKLSNAVNLSGIDGGAFAGCASLKHVELPDNCRRLGELAFAGCENLEELVLPATIKGVVGNAFIGCDRLHEIKVAKGGNYLFEEGILYDKSKGKLIRCLIGDQVDSVKIEEGVTLIMPSAFDGCKHLKNVTLPSSLKHIGDFAFANSGLKEIVLPEGLESIGYAAFEKTSVKLAGRLTESETRGVFGP